MHWKECWLTLRAQETDTLSVYHLASEAGSGIECDILHNVSLLKVLGSRLRKKDWTIGLLTFCLAVFQFPGLQASSEWNLKGLVKQTVVYISGSILMSNYRMIFCTGHLVRLPRRYILQLKAGACMFGVQAKKKMCTHGSVMVWEPLRL